MSPKKITPPTAGSSFSMLSHADAIFDAATLQKSWEILGVIHRYRTSTPDGTTDRSDEGSLKFLSMICPVQLILPAFPFKSPNRKHKTLGALPDKGEELALAHLNGLCAAITDIYEPGAILTIASDGLVYSDLLGVSDAEVYAYGEALRRLVHTQGCKNIQFVRLRNLLHWHEDTPLDATTYERLANDFRQRLIDTFTPLDYDVASSIKTDGDVCATYRGYIKFLAKDLEHTFVEGERSKKSHKQHISDIAKAMIGRGKAFAEAIQKTFPQHVRLSIHPSCGSTKLPIHVLPQARNLITPWHSAPCFTVDGRMEYSMRERFDASEDIERVSRNGQPWYYRFKSDLYSWSPSVELEPLYPCGLLIRPTQPTSAQELPMGPLRELAQQNSPLVLRGFDDTKDKELFVTKAEEMGTPLPWKFGLILEVKDHGTDTQGLNNVLSSEWMPFHYDGLFKIQKGKDAEGKDISLSFPPNPSPKDTGFTLFSPSHLVWHYLPAGYTVEQLEKLRWTVETTSFDQSRSARLAVYSEYLR
ncbi:hypothetical protein BO71DRAFT_424302 [Aspergillus ellipticus CBS 707.79]|uniref:Pyoverdine/dityrosine biosynthesis protein n=1 Tax=Aspergillus ellipticus CBS 707.79 TaxID=1448320 RepID=A0A319CQL8_9EURO|nr:hypothetical protein BO71DRAFT_424302 [Aspergillus ellipticus CBS 707.79]